MENRKDIERWLLKTVQSQDRDRYLCAMFLPPERRFAVMCVLAFHAEVSRVRETVTETTMGYIRLQWWYDALEENSDVLGASPIVRAVLGLPELKSLRPYLFQILEARYKDQERQPFASVAEAENWIAQTVSPFVQALACAAGLPEQETSVALHQATKAHALIGLLRATKAFRDLGKPLWAFKLDTPQARQDLAQKVVPLAETALQTARQHQEEVPSAGFAFLMLAALTDQHLAVLKKHNYEIFTPKFVGPSRVTPRFLWTWIRHRI